MNFKEYQSMSYTTRNKKLTAQENVYAAIFGISGEFGEVADDLKKHFFQGHDIDIEHVSEEIGDVLWYIALLATSLNLSLEDIAEKNTQKLNKRYDGGFTEEKSVNRK